MPPRVLALGYLSIDRIALPTGVFRPVPGGAALYAALGARAAGGQAGIAAACGQDYPSAWLETLKALGIDLAGVTPRAGSTRSASLAYDAAGGRHSVHFDELGWAERTHHFAPPLPDDLSGVGGIALGPMPVETMRSAIETRRTGGRIVIADTSAAFVRRAPGALLALLPGLDVFAPSLEETRLLVPGAGDDAAAVMIAALGTDVLQKRGAAGAYLVRRGAATGIVLAAPQAHVVIDPTGAGDATLGALTAYRLQGLDLLDAAAQAMRIGALAVQDIGPAALGFDAWRSDAMLARPA